MPSLTGSISFNVAFDFTGTVPAVILSASTTIASIDQPNLIGNFTVTQPDGVPLVGAAGQVAWTGSGYNTITVPLSLASDYTYQKGVYTIFFFAACAGYTYGTFTRSWDMEYLPVSQTFINGFDVYTPLLQYTDSTNYGVGSYSITGQTYLWTVASAAGSLSGTAATLNFSIGGNYYDSTYYIVYATTINYLHTSYSWLTVMQKTTANITLKAYKPESMAQLLTYLVSIKDARDAAISNCITYDTLDETFEDANELYQLMRSRICAQNVTGLSKTFEQFYQTTHNNQSQVYINTNTVMPVYDFTTGCLGAGSGSGGIGLFYSMRATYGVNSFTVPLPAGSVITQISRSGFSKGITASATTDPEFLQVVALVVTLPTGDVVNQVTLPDLTVTGELFLITYK